MPQINITAEDLLAGSSAKFEIEIPPEVLHAGKKSNGKQVTVVLQPINIETLQLIMKASKDNSSLIPLLLIKEGVIAPKLALNQIQKMHIGLVDFLVQEIRHISGMQEKKNSTTT